MKLTQVLIGENMYDKSINKEIATKIFNILVEHAGAYDNESELESFIWAQGEKPKQYNESGGCTEYRFGGKLGFGGKFWNANSKFYVSAYSEDTGSKQSKIIEKVNELLKTLYLEHKKIKRQLNNGKKI